MVKLIIINKEGTVKEQKVNSFSKDELYKKAGLKKPDIVYYETDTNNGIVSNANSYIIDKLNVDYFTVYLGFSFKLDPKRKDKRKSRKKDKGRHI